MISPAISAIIISIQMITKFCRHLKYKKKIVLVTDASGSIDGTDLSQVTDKLKSDGIELVVL